MLFDGHLKLHHDYQHAKITLDFILPPQYFKLLSKMGIVIIGQLAM